MSTQFGARTQRKFSRRALAGGARFERTLPGLVARCPPLRLPADSADLSRLSHHSAGVALVAATGIEPVNLSL